MLRTYIRLLDTSDETVKADLQRAEGAGVADTGTPTLQPSQPLEQPQPSRPLQQVDVKYIVGIAVVLVLVIAATALTRKLK